MNQDILQRYKEELGCRFKKKQKAKARTALSEDFEALGYTGEVQSKRNLILSAHNLIFGNLKSCRYVILIPYDTPGRIFWPNLHYYPMDGNKTASKATLPTYGPVVVFYFLFLGILYALPALALNAYAYIAISIVSIVIFAMMFMLLFHGFSNKHNATRNTSGVITALALAQSLSKDQRRQISFVFTDRNEKRHFGSKLIADRLKEMNKNPMVMVLNCLGNGSQLVLGATSGNKKAATEMMKKYKGSQKVSVANVTTDMQVQSPMGYFPKGICIASGELDDKNSLVVDHTCSPKDTILDETNIDDVAAMLQSFFEANK